MKEPWWNFLDRSFSLRLRSCSLGLLRNREDCPMPTIKALNIISFSVSPVFEDISHHHHTSGLDLFDWSSFVPWIVPNAAGTKSDIKDANNAAASGYGFACFVYLIGFFLASAMSWFMSPYYGTKRELQMLKTPSDLEGTTPSQQASIPVAAAVGVDPASSSHSHASLYDGYPKTS